MFKKVKFTIDNHQYEILLVAEDSLIVDELNKAVFLNQTSWVIGEIPLAFPSNSEIKVSISHLSKQLFEEIVNADLQTLAKFLTSDNKNERELANTVLHYRWNKPNSPV